jgi:2EXR family
MILVKWPAHLLAFNRFPKFAAEIRLKIWKAALPPPRTLFLDWIAIPVAPLSSDACYRYSLSERNYSVTEPINFLLACKEARQVFLDHYHRLRWKNQSIGRAHNWNKKVFNFPEVEPISPPYGYFDGKRDTVVILLEDHLGKLALGFDFSALEKVAVRTHDVVATKRITSWVAGMPNLKQLTILPGELRDYDSYLPRPNVPHLVPFNNDKSRSILAQPKNRLHTRRYFAKRLSYYAKESQDRCEQVHGYLKSAQQYFTDRTAVNIKGFESVEVRQALLGRCFPSPSLMARTCIRVF